MAALDSVSVVIPTFNRARFLPDAIRSVLGQSHRNLELIVVDDGSTDDTSQVLRPFVDERLQVVRIPHSGRPAHARNVGIARATGQFLAFLDSDDVWLATKLEDQLDAMRASPGCRWSYTLFDHIDERGSFMAPLRGGVGHARSGWIVESMITEDALVLVPSVLAEASLIREAGGFDETPGLREDLDLCFRLATRSQACAVDKELLRVRHHADRTTYALAEVRRWRVKALRKLAESNTDPTIARLCRQECFRELVDLARAYDGSGRPAASLGALGRALRYGPFHAVWWTTLAKTALRPVTPARVLQAYRRRRDGGVAPTITSQGERAAVEARLNLPHLRLRVSVLGLPVLFETNTAEVLELIHDAYGGDGRAGDARDGDAGSSFTGREVRVRILADPALKGADAPVPQVDLPEPHRLELTFGDGYASADAEVGEAVAHVSRVALGGPGFREALLDHLTLFLVTRWDRCPIHAGAIARNGRAMLLAGPSGLGKSSLTYAAMRLGFQVLADDAIYVQREPNLRLWSLPRRIHLPGEATRYFPELVGSPATLRPDGRWKVPVTIPQASRAPVPWTGRVALCLLSDPSGGRTAEPMLPDAAVPAMRATLQGGFGRFSSSLDDCVRRLSDDGSWLLPVAAEPVQMVRRIEELLDSIGSGGQR